jgi:hypothetical protein
MSEGRNEQKKNVHGDGARTAENSEQEGIADSKLATYIGAVDGFCSYCNSRLARLLVSRRLTLGTETTPSLFGFIRRSACGRCPAGRHAAAMSSLLACCVGTRFFNMFTQTRVVQIRTGDDPPWYHDIAMRRERNSLRCTDLELAVTSIAKMAFVPF